MKSIYELSKMGSSDLQDVISVQQNAVILLDVRTLFEYSRTSIPGAKHIPCEDLSSHITEIQAWQRPVVTYSSNGDRSKKAAAFLRKFGITAVNGGARNELQILLRKENLKVLN